MMVLITLIARLAPTISESDWLAERKEPLWVDILRWVGMGLFAVHAALLGYAWLRNLQESTLIRNCRSTLGNRALDIRHLWFTRHADLRTTLCHSIS